MGPAMSPAPTGSFRNFAIFSAIAFTLISCLIVSLIPPFESTQANLTVAVLFVVFYVLLIWALHKRTYDIPVLMLIILLLFCMFVPSLKRAKTRDEKMKQSLTTPRTN